MVASPSLFEHSGPYNVNEDEYRQFLVDPSEEPEAYFKLQPNLPVLTRVEFETVRDATYLVLMSVGRPEALSGEHTRAYYRYAIHEGTLDRTIELQLPQVELMTVELITAFQRQVLEAHPLWRIHIVGAEPESSVLVYPRSVRIGDLPESPNWQAQLITLRAAEQQLHDDVHGFQDRQLSLVKSRVGSLISQLDATPVLIIAICDNFNGTFESITVWTMHRGRSDSEYRVAQPVAGMGFTYFIHPDGWFEKLPTHREEGIRLAQWVIPAEWRGSLIVKRESELSDSDYSLVSEITDDVIITDDQLRLQE